MRARVLVPLITLVVAAQVCCCCTIFGGPQPPYTITPSDEAVQRFEERMNSAEIGADGSFTITITEEEMTSLIVQEFAEQGEPLPISEPQMHFRNGRAELYATVQFTESLALPGMIALSITATDGKVKVTVEEISFGPLPIPESIVQSLADGLSETLAEGVQGDDVDALITDVQIGEGEMSISGQILGN